MREAGSGKREAGSGSAKREGGSGKREAGGGKRDAGSAGGHPDATLSEAKSRVGSLSRQGLVSSENCNSPGWRPNLQSKTSKKTKRQKQKLDAEDAEETQS